jgi:hypothetical protein
MKALVEKQPFRPFMIETIGRKEILISRSDAVLLPAFPDRTMTAG